MAVPIYDVDFYSDEFILDPYPHYAKMRALGPVVWLPQNNVFALARYAEVTKALRSPKLFISSKGLSLSQKVNDLLVGSTLNSDPPEHDLTRSITAAPLLPGALRMIEDRIRAAADGLVAHLVTRGQFDAIADLAQHLPVTIVAELVGLPDAGQEKMLQWASATFNLFGSENQRTRDAFEDLKDLRAFLDKYGTPEQLKPGGWAARIFEVGPERGLSYESCAQLMRDYINPSLDTTISATGQAIRLFAENTDQWQLIRNDASLIPNAVEEVVRFSSPIRAFSRFVVQDTELAGTLLPKGARVLAIYASANRDERKFPNPDSFDIRRDVHDHVGFGTGIHMCMGMHLAKLEIISLLESLRRRVERFELAGAPVIAMNNTIRAYQSLPVRVEGRDIADSAPALQPRDAQSDWIEVVVHERRAQAEDIISLELRDPSGKALPSFEAGAHVDVSIRSGLVRQYSLCNDPIETHRYRLGILLDPASRGGSASIHAGLMPGRTISIGSPRNKFPLQRLAKHSLLFAGGIGVTPILAMAYALQRDGQSFEMHYCARSADKLAFRDELKTFGDSLHIHLDDGSPTQRLAIEDVLRERGLDRHLYVCGPGGFMDYVVNSAHKLGWDGSCIHTERFGAEVNTDGVPFKVVAARSGKTLEIRPGETIAGRLQEAGIEVNMSCQSGVCGTCLTRVLDGTPDHRDLVMTDSEKAGNGKIAICCSRSKTRQLVLDI